MRNLILALLLFPAVALAADGDTCASQSHETFTNSAACVIVCDDAYGTDYQCNGGNGFAPPAGYRGGAVQIEIADDPGSCEVKVYMGSSATSLHYLDTLLCGTTRTRLTIPAGEHIAGHLYFVVDGGQTDVVAHYELGED